MYISFCMYTYSRYTHKTRIELLDNVDFRVKMTKGLS